MGKGQGPQPPIDVSNMTPTQALASLLENAQHDHKVCVTKAVEAKEDVVEKCALTWGEVHLRWRQFAAYRAPFKDDEADAKYAGYWTKKRIEWDDNRLF